LIDTPLRMQIFAAIAASVAKYFPLVRSKYREATFPPRQG
jgi:hypothetical protein